MPAHGSGSSLEIEIAYQDELSIIGTIMLGIEGYNVSPAHIFDSALVKNDFSIGVRLEQDLVKQPPGYKFRIIALYCQIIKHRTLDIADLDPGKRRPEQNLTEQPQGIFQVFSEEGKAEFCVIRMCSD